MSLQNTIDQDIKKAMLSKDSARLRGLRAIKAALLVARTEKGASPEASSEEEIKVLQKLVKQRKESAEIYKQQGREDLVTIEEEELATIEAYLPKQLDRAAIEAQIKTIITETGANGMKDMGKVMGLSNKKMAGQADGKTISEIVRQQLSENR